MEGINIQVHLSLHLINTINCLEINSIVFFLKKVFLNKKFKKKNIKTHSNEINNIADDVLLYTRVDDCVYLFALQ